MSTSGCRWCLCVRTLHYNYVLHNAVSPFYSHYTNLHLNLCTLLRYVFELIGQVFKAFGHRVGAKPSFEDSTSQPDVIARHPRWVIQCYPSFNVQQPRSSLPVAIPSPRRPQHLDTKTRVRMRTMICAFRIVSSYLRSRSYTPKTRIHVFVPSSCADGCPRSCLFFSSVRTDKTESLVLCRCEAFAVIVLAHTTLILTGVVVF